MILCLDSNVFVRIAEQRSTKRLAPWLRRHGHVVLLADQVVAEATRTPDPVIRSHSLRAMFALAPEIRSRPDSYATAMEVRDEIRSIHPEWMEPHPDLRELNAFLRRRQRLYRQMKEHPSMEFDQAYASTVRAAVGALKTSQGDRRRQYLEMPDLKLELRVPGGEALQPQLDTFRSLPDADKYWRYASRSMWANALRGASAMRDYADWLSPYLLSVPSEPGWSEFWLFEASASNMRRDHVIGVCEYYQGFEKIEAGNAGDMLIAAHLLDADAIVTADRRFHRILCRVIASHGPFRATPLLVERGADDFLSNVQQTIAAWHHQRASDKLLDEQVQGSGPLLSHSATSPYSCRPTSRNDPGPGQLSQSDRHQIPLTFPAY